MNREIGIRLSCVKLYQEIGNAGIVCHRCGISRPTLRKWVKRYEEPEREGLLGKNKRPKNLPLKKVTDQQESYNQKLCLSRIKQDLEDL